MLIQNERYQEINDKRNYIINPKLKRQSIQIKKQRQRKLLHSVDHRIFLNLTQQEKEQEIQSLLDFKAQKLKLSNKGKEQKQYQCYQLNPELNAFNPAHKFQINDGKLTVQCVDDQENKQNFNFSISKLNSNNFTKQSEIESPQIRQFSQKQTKIISDNSNSQLIIKPQEFKKHISVIKKNNSVNKSQIQQKQCIISHQNQNLFPKLNKIKKKSDFIQKSEITQKPDSTQKSEQTQKFKIETKQTNIDLKIQQFKDFFLKINISNNQIFHQNIYTSKYEVYIGKGNNSQLLETVFKKRQFIHFFYKILQFIKKYNIRWWWRITENIDSNTHLVWTQLKQQTCIDQNPSINKNQISFSELQQNSNQINDLDQNQLKIFNRVDFQNLKQILKHSFIPNKFEQEVLKIKPNLRKIQQINAKSHNHLDKNFHLGNKKALFYNIQQYCELLKENPFDYIPVTFHIQNGANDKEYQRFLEFYKQRQFQIKAWEQLPEQQRKVQNCPKNIYIIKPGEVSNRGNGITVESDLDAMMAILKQKQYHKTGHLKTYIVQLYIDKPLLYNKRKFDIRCYLLITSQNGILKGYWYQEGYVRTSSSNYSLKNLSNKTVHLTNDAIQQKSEDYGKYEGANKISFKDFEKYINQNYPNIDFQKDILDKMQQITMLSVRSVYGLIDDNKKDNTFEIFGLDFMIDEDFKIYLIEVNTNPCLETCSTLLARLIPNMIENALKISVDSIFPPPESHKWVGMRNLFIPENILESNKFNLIFDELQEDNFLVLFFELDSQIYVIDEEHEEEIN